MSRDALIVGINTYGYERLNNLKAPAEDAEAIAQLLEQYGEFTTIQRLPAVKKEGAIRVGQKTKVTLDILEDALVQLFTPEGKNIPETALLYFSGHGLRKVKGRVQEGYLATSDANPDQGLYGLSLQWLRRLLQASPVRQQIIILDCCYSGELHNFAEADPGDRGKGRDRCFIAASREFEVAYEETAGNHGILTSAILQGLDPTGQADGVVTNYTLVDFIYQALKGVPQQPTFANSGGKIILTGIQQEITQTVLEGICPYKGLSYFDCNSEDAKYFYGRTALTDQLLEGVREGNFLAVLGASGSGKSSVVRAGLLYQLKQGQRLSGSDTWQIYIFRPGEHPLQSLAEAFVDPEASAVERASQLLKAEELIGLGSMGLVRIVNAAPSRVVLVADQFEEAFTLCTDITERQQFFACLLEAVEQTNNKLCLVLSMRADFFGKCAEQEYGGLARKIQENLVTVTPMTQEELEQAITEPAKQVGLDVERELVTQMLTDVEGSPGSLPLLQYTLTELWQRRTMNRLLLGIYTQLGGVKGTLQKRATEVYDSLSDEERQTTKRIFLELTQLGEGTEDTRRQVRQPDLVSLQQSPALVDQVIQKLADAKLIVTSTLLARGSDSEPVAVVDVAHEALIRSWPLLRQWLSENREALRQKRNIEADAQEWLDKGKAGDYLLQGLKLAEAEDFLQRDSDNVSLSSLAQDYVEVSQKERDRIRQAEEERRQRELEQERRARKAAQMRNRVAAISVVALTGLTTFAFVQTRKAERESIAAQTQTSEAFFSSGKKFDALVEAVQAGKRLKEAKLEQNAELDQTVTFKLHQAVYEVQERNRVLGHKGDINSVSFSPDGKIIASASTDGTIKLWNLEGQELKTRPMSHNRGKFSGVNEISFSPDGKMLVSGGGDGRIKLWSLEGQELKTFGGGYGVKSVTFSPDGKLIASVNRMSLNGTITRTIRLWNLEGQVLKTFILPRNDKPIIDDIYSVSFSPDGKTIATGSADGIIKLWNLEGEELKTRPMSHGGSITEVKFSPDGKTIATASDDRTIKLWSVEGEALKTLTEHSSSVNSVKFSLDGKTIASASGDGTIKLWNLKGRLLKTLTGHSGYVSSVNFSPDGKTLVSGSGDKTIRLWNIDTQEHQTLIGDGWAVYRVSFSPDGQTIAFAGEADTIKLWNLEGQSLTTLPGHTDSVNDVSFSPDGKMLASASKDKTVKVWNLEGNKQLKTFSGYGDTVYSVRFSPDGKTIAFGGVGASGMGSTKLWNLEGKELKTFSGSPAMFSPDGKIIASASLEQMTLWNLEGKELKTYSGHIEYIGSMSFSPDGQTIASASDDKTIKLWHLESEKVKTLSDHNAAVEDVSFSPNGRLIASTAGDGIKLWSRDGQLLFKAFTDHSDYVFRSLSFSPNGKMLALGGQNALNPAGVVTLLNFDLDELLGRGCNLLRDYLKNPNNGMSQDDTRRTICNDVKPSSRLLEEQASDLIQQGNIKSAIAVYREAYKLDTALKITAYSWNYLCWDGSLRGYAKDVMFACENAVRLASEKADFYRDSRGIARALTGDTKGAIEDFQAFIKWTEKEEGYSGYRTRRQRWIDALRAGENPFTPEEKERLLKE